MSKKSDVQAEIEATEAEVQRLETLLARQKQLEAQLDTGKRELRKVHAQRYQTVEKELPADFDLEAERQKWLAKQAQREKRRQRDIERGREERLGVPVRFGTPARGIGGAK
jgi:hypothetical protein